jgi:hypothetical protein
VFSGISRHVFAPLLPSSEIVTQGVDSHASRRERQRLLSANIHTLAKAKGSLRLETIVKKRIFSIEHLLVLQIEHLQHILSYSYRHARVPGHLVATAESE